eukprot:TRINITY_DN21572_c0_g1_i1.p3 TRINITY_DN21572_c0_g1~~TRINITY_DN21572_c0_g1_i1.p3  ORF type:complete len:240 (-),score=38.15 TRINITY_DN21572_c0_g1_i1:463-1140(-)
MYNKCARINGNSQDALASAHIVPLAGQLLKSEDVSVRARTANVIGNLCRHGARLYAEIDRHEVIPILIDLCKDHDRSVRKFACFALGNAGFHSASLYPQLRNAIEPLVGLLGDEESKTRTNAAGALGNLVRNSDLLCQDLVQGGALQALLQVVDQAENVHPQSEVGGSPVRIALFSLGNMCSHVTCRQVLEQLGIREVIGKLRESQDEVVRKYVDRIYTKLQMRR